MRVGVSSDMKSKWKGDSVNRKANGKPSKRRQVT